MKLLKLILLILVLTFSLSAFAKVGDEFRKAISAESGMPFRLGQSYKQYKKIASILRYDFQERIAFDFLNIEVTRTDHKPLDIADELEQVATNEQAEIFHNLQVIAGLHCAKMKDPVGSFIELANIADLQTPDDKLIAMSNDLQKVTLTHDPYIIGRMLALTQYMKEMQQTNTADFYNINERELRFLFSSDPVKIEGVSMVDGLPYLKYGSEIRLKLLDLSTKIETQEQLDLFSDTIERIKVKLALELKNKTTVPKLTLDEIHWDIEDLNNGIIQLDNKLHHQVIMFCRDKLPSYAKTRGQ